MNLNKVAIAGNLTRDPELKFTPKGTAVCKFGVAVNRKWANESGEKKEDVTFLDVEAWGKTAEAISQYFKKGRGIYVDGRLRLESWDDKQTGQKRSKLGVVCESFQFTDSKPDGDSRSAAPRQTPAPIPADDNPPHEGDDVPF